MADWLALLDSAHARPEDEVLASMEIDYSHLRVANPPIAKGGFGIINKAVYRGTLVAVKTLICMLSEGRACICG